MERFQLIRRANHKLYRPSWCIEHLSLIQKTLRPLIQGMPESWKALFVISTIGGLSKHRALRRGKKLLLLFVLVATLYRPIPSRAWICIGEPISGKLSALSELCSVIFSSAFGVSEDTKRASPLILLFPRKWVWWLHWKLRRLPWPPVYTF